MMTQNGAFLRWRGRAWGVRRKCHWGIFVSKQGAQVANLLGGRVSGDASC